MKNKNFINDLKIRNFRIGIFLITMLAMSMVQLNANAQLYKRTTFNTTYTPITVGGGATVSTATGDDVNQTAIPLGFTLNYAGVNYASVGLNTNGLLFFDAVAPTAAEGASFNNMFVSGAGGTDKSVSAWWADMIDDASSDILYQTKGTAGSKTFTVQYTNYPHWHSTGGTNVRLNFQVIFYESTNVIEFNYGTRAVTGPPTVSGGACIGIEYGTGGAGNFIDLVTGSGQTAHGMLSPLVAWPAYSYRLTPGAPTPVAAGTYNVGIGQTYPSLTLATSDLNHRGISGPVTLNLTDANYDTTMANGSHIFPVFVGPFLNSSSVNTVTISKTGTPATFSYRGSPVVQGGFGFGSTGGLSGIPDSEEPIMGVCSRYTTISNINLVSLGTTANDVEVGLMIFESFAGDSGAQHNVFDKISINMDRTNSNTIGIHSNNMTNPGGIQGSNSYNTYRDITIRDCYAGIYLQGAGGVYEPDAGNQIISSSCTTFNSIGDPAVPNDIGGGSATYGIWLGAQNTFIVRNTIIRNISTTSSSSAIDGILVSSAKGVCEISNNIIRTIKRNSTGAGGSFILTGIRLSHSNAINEFRIFNNSISELLTTYTGVATASYGVRGIYFDDTGSGTNTFNIWNNSISIDGSTFPNASNTCIQFLDGADFTVNMKNNVLANFTSAQTGVARHFCIVSSHVDRYGLVASLSDYNDLYIANDQGTSGHVGLGATTNYSTLGAWQAGMSFNVGTDANSVSANPNFVNNNSDLHATVTSTALDETGTTIPAFITTDIDCQTRIAPHDIGFDDFTPGCPANGGTITPATASACASSTYSMASTGVSTGGATTYQWQRSTTLGGPYSNVSGGSGATTTAYTTGALATGTYYYVLKTTCGDGGTDLSNELKLTVNASPGSTITPSGPLTFCSGGSVVLSAPTGGSKTYQWKKSGINISGATASSYTASSTGNYKVVVTNTASGCSKITPTATVVTVNALPAATITPLGPTTFCAGGSVVLQGNTGAGFTFKWKKNGNYIIGATLSAYTATTSGNYKVEVTNSNGCSKLSASITVTVPCKEGEESISSTAYNVSVFPNPAQSEIHIALSSKENFEIEIMNAIGKSIIKTRNQKDIDISALSNGVYLIKVFTAEQVTMLKFVKE